MQLQSYCMVLEITFQFIPVKTFTTHKAAWSNTYWKYTWYTYFFKDVLSVAKTFFISRKLMKLDFELRIEEVIFFYRFTTKFRAHNGIWYRLPSIKSNRNIFSISKTTACTFRRTERHDLVLLRLILRCEERLKTLIVHPTYSVVLS